MKPILSFLVLAVGLVILPLVSMADNPSNPIGVQCDIQDSAVSNVMTVNDTLCKQIYWNAYQGCIAHGGEQTPTWCQANLYSLISTKVPPTFAALYIFCKPGGGNSADIVGCEDDIAYFTSLGSKKSPKTAYVPPSEKNLSIYPAGCPTTDEEFTNIPC